MHIKPTLLASSGEIGLDSGSSPYNTPVPPTMPAPSEAAAPEECSIPDCPGCAYAALAGSVAETLGESAVGASIQARGGYLAGLSLLHLPERFTDELDASLLNMLPLFGDAVENHASLTLSAADVDATLSVVDALLDENEDLLTLVVIADAHLRQTLAHATCLASENCTPAERASAIYWLTGEN